MQQSDLISKFISHTRMKQIMEQNSSQTRGILCCGTQNQWPSQWTKKTLQLQCYPKLWSLLKFEIISSSWWWGKVNSGTSSISSVGWRKILKVRNRKKRMRGLEKRTKVVYWVENRIKFVRPWLYICGNRKYLP